MKSAVTVSLVPEARGGPFVFWYDLRVACAMASNLGFDAVELFPPSASALKESGLTSILAEHRLSLAAVGTGAGWVKHQLTLTSPDAVVRQHAREFIEGIVDEAGPLGVPVIIGSMQGRSAPAPEDRDAALGHLREALQRLGERARRYNLPLIYEPLNRYETNLVNTIEAGAELLKSIPDSNIRLLADLFHMNIEEANVPAAIRAGGSMIGHVHLADSNRRAAGHGHTDFAPIAAALREIGYDGYVSAEALPHPNSLAAARATIEAFNRFFKA